MKEFAENISAEEIESLEYADFAGPIALIKEIGEDYAEALDYLSKQKVLGFDTETKPSFKHGEPRHSIALLQLSGADKAYLFRLQSLGLPKSIADIMADPEIIKVGAAVHDDIKGLQVYRKFVPRGFVDLQKISANYGILDKSVRKLAAIVLGLRVSKSQQLSNWEAPQLSGAQLKYAAIDAWVSREIFLKLHSIDQKKCNPSYKG